MSWNPNNHPNVDEFLWEELSGGLERYIHPWDIKEITEVYEYLHEAGFNRGQKHAKEGRDIEVDWNHSASKYIYENPNAVESSMDLIVEVVGLFHEVIMKDVIEWCDEEEKNDEDYIDAIYGEREDELYRHYFVCYNKGYEDGMRYLSRQVWNSLNEQAESAYEKDKRLSHYAHQQDLYWEACEERKKEGLHLLCRPWKSYDGRVFFYMNYGLHYDHELGYWTHL